MRKSGSKNYINLKVWVIPALALCLAVIALFYLPEQIPMQLGHDGQVNYYGSKFAILLWPFLGAVLLLMGNIVPIIDPRGNRYEKFGKEYNLIHLVMLLFLLATEVMVILVSLGYQVNIPMLIPLLLGAILVIIGNRLPRIQQNYLTGVKTIWGYQNEKVWNKTQRLAGRVWFVCGILMMLSALLPWLYIPELLLIVAMLLIPRVYSYIQYEKERHGTDEL